MTHEDTMAAKIANMDTISVIIKDSNFLKVKTKINHEEACNLIKSGLLYSHKVNVNSSGQHMTIYIN